MVHMVLCEFGKHIYLFVKANQNPFGFFVESLTHCAEAEPEMPKGKGKGKGKEEGKGDQPGNPVPFLKKHGL